MKRRVALAAVASSFGATASCLGLLPSQPDGPLGGGSEAETTTSTPNGGTTSESSPGGGTSTSGERTEGGDDGTQNDSSAAIETCPSFVVENADVEEILCNGDGTDADIYLAAESDTVSSSGSIDFTLRNLTGGSQLYIPCRWALYERSNGSWEAIQPLAGDTTQKRMFGGFETLTLSVGREPSTDADQCPYTLDNPSPGLYLFGVQVVREGGLLVLASFEVTE